MLLMKLRWSECTLSQSTSKKQHVNGIIKIVERLIFIVHVRGGGGGSIMLSDNDILNIYIEFAKLFFLS